MTHEFKTPIATINLALDSIKNPKIINDQEKILRYVKMIRDENKRMHGQVENVLRISRLKKKQIEINKEALEMHDVIIDAISHVSLLSNDKKGSITTHFEAIQSEILVNQFHMTNVLVNMLENALKYSESSPKIDVFTQNTNKNLIIKIMDEGIGISKNAQKQIEINKEALDMHDIISDAISHVSLLSNDKKGTITIHFEAIQSEILVNQFHMTNVLVNMLENALKYSENSPKIDVFTQNTNKNLIIKIKDEGIGISKNAQKQIFNKFYREQKGNIHDVKGHGLGLAYVKEILDSHHGTVFVESEKGKGSTFTIKLPLI